MDNMPPSHLSFYKFLTHPTQDFELPPGFTNKHRDILPECAKLRIASGAMWRVRVEKLENQRYYLTRGWSQFSRDMELEVFEILVFYYVGDSTFHVCAYGVDSSEKMTNFRVFENLAAASSEFEPRSPLDLGFQVVLTHSYRYRLNVPRHLAEGWGLIERKKVELEYPGGRGAEVNVVSKLWPGRRMMVYLSGGWNKFCQANRMSIGKAYSVEFDPAGDFIRVYPAPLSII